MVRSGTRGFTLTELLIVVAISAVLVAAALPSYNEFVRNQRVKTASFDLFSSLVQARSEAITRNAPVTVAPIITGTETWAGGWTVTIDAGRTELRRQDAIVAITLTGPAGLVYNGSGRLSTASGSFQLTGGSGGGITMRCITVDLSGRPVTKAAAC